MGLVDWSPDHEYETIKVFNGKKCNMKDKKDKEKLKKVRKEERHRTRVVKLMNRYGIPEVNEWIKKHPNTMTVTYEFYLEEEKNITIRKIGAFVSLGISLVMMVASFYVIELCFLALAFLLVGYVLRTGLIEDRIEQEHLKDMVLNMYRLEKEIRNETNEG